MFRIVCDPSAGITELCLTEITLSGSQIFFVCLIGVWQRNFEPAVCVCVCARYDGLGTRNIKGICVQWVAYFSSVELQNVE